MNKQAILVFCLSAIFATAAPAQLKLKLQKLPEGNTWGVFVTPCPSVAPSNNTITGSGQVTIVGLAGTSFSDLTNHAGTWTGNMVVSNPVEAPGRVCFSAGFTNDHPKILYQAGVETLLFTFQATGENAGSISLIENGAGPFDQLPNSPSSNPGNELSVVDFNVSPTGFYFYEGNYQPENALCSSEGEAGGGHRAGRPINLQPRWFHLSPNPALEWVQVDFGNNRTDGGSVIKLLNANGVLLGKLEKREQNLMEINVRELPSGIYYILLEQKGKIIQQERFIK